MPQRRCFQIAPPSADSVLRFRLVELWDMATAQQFDHALRAQFKALRTSGQPFDVIADLRDWPVQTQETTKVHEELMAFGKECGMRHVAILTRSVLAKMQVLRAAANDAFHAFAEQGEAEDWIASKRPA